MPSGCVWWTWGQARTRAAASRSSSAASSGRAGGATGGRPCPRRSSARSISGRTSSRRRPVKCSGPIVARSLPEPLTHMTGTSRPTWSTAVPWLRCCRRRSSRPRDRRPGGGGQDELGQHVLGGQLGRPEVRDGVDEGDCGAHRVISWCGVGSGWRACAMRAERPDSARPRSGPRRRRARRAPATTAGARRCGRRRAGPRGARTSPCACASRSASRSTSSALA